MPNTLDIIVKNPIFITRVEEVDETLAKLDDYTRKTGQTAVVLKRQNRSLGAVCTITSEEEALREIKKPFTQDTAEKGIAYFSRTYYESLRKGLEQEQQYGD